MCRAVLFAQLVDDPSAWPEEFPTEEDQKRERVRLHGIIAEMVPWEATNDPRILNKARFEIARSLARTRGDTLPPSDDAEAVSGYLRQHAPPVTHQLHARIGEAGHSHTSSLTIAPHELILGQVSKNYAR